MSNQKRFTIAGITTHGGTNAHGQKSERTKVRYGTDLPRLAKMLSSAKKIWNKDLGICLAPQRVDLVNLPTEMTKEEALAYLAGLPEFQSADDQFVIKEAQHSRSAKARSAAKRAEKVVKGAPSLDAIRARGVKTEA